MICRTCGRWRSRVACEGGSERHVSRQTRRSEGTDIKSLPAESQLQAGLAECSNTHFIEMFSRANAAQATLKSLPSLT